MPCRRDGLFLIIGMVDRVLGGTAISMASSGSRRKKNGGSDDPPFLMHPYQAGCRLPGSS
jgi:hypothetical protein